MKKAINLTKSQVKINICERSSEELVSKQMREELESLVRDELVGIMAFKTMPIIYNNSQRLKEYLNAFFSTMLTEDQIEAANSKIKQFESFELTKDIFDLNDEYEEIQEQLEEEGEREFDELFNEPTEGFKQYSLEYVAGELEIPLETIKERIKDGTIRTVIEGVESLSQAEVKKLIKSEI